MDKIKITISYQTPEAAPYTWSELAETEISVTEISDGNKALLAARITEAAAAKVGEQQHANSTDRAGAKLIEALAGIAKPLRDPQTGAFAFDVGRAVTEGSDGSDESDAAGAETDPNDPQGQRREHDIPEPTRA